MTEYRLPFPPSSNNLFLNARGRGRVLAPDYRKWRTEAGQELMLQRPRPIPGRVDITIDLDDTRQGDCANREKALVDLLVAHGIIQGDQKKYVRRVSIGWEKLTGCRVTITGAA
jgi:Holliday junction resolvase RusA-like endonuclease